MIPSFFELCIIEFWNTSNFFTLITKSDYYQKWIDQYVAATIILLCNWDKCRWRLSSTHTRPVVRILQYAFMYNGHAQSMHGLDYHNLCIMGTVDGRGYHKINALFVTLVGCCHLMILKPVFRQIRQICCSGAYRSPDLAIFVSTTTTTTMTIMTTELTALPCMQGNYACIHTL